LVLSVPRWRQNVRQGKECWQYGNHDKLKRPIYIGSNSIQIWKALREEGMAIQTCTENRLTNPGSNEKSIFVLLKQA
jgi:hypothetical protein